MTRFTDAQWERGGLAPLSDLLRDPDLSHDEKRARLASWASDACAVAGNPGLRRVPGTRCIVGVHEILEALRALDREAGEFGYSPALRRVRRASIEAFRERRAWSP
jgi:hypothetical protein